jgi:hypothetical protein
MPHVNIWIRKADYDKWQKLPNKPEAISKMLRGETLQAVYVKETVLDQGFYKEPVRTPVRASGKVCKEHHVDKSICALMKHK